MTWQQLDSSNETSDQCRRKTNRDEQVYLKSGKSNFQLIIFLVGEVRSQVQQLISQYSGFHQLKMITGFDCSTFQYTRGLQVFIVISLIALKVNLDAICVILNISQT